MGRFARGRESGIPQSTQSCAGECRRDSGRGQRPSARWRVLQLPPIPASSTSILATWRSVRPADIVICLPTTRHRRPPKIATFGAPMITAIVLIKAEPPRIAECATKLAGIDGVSQVYSVSGEWDLVAMLEVAQHEAIARIVTEEVTVVPGIKSTHTLTAFRAYSKKDLEQA